MNKNMLLGIGAVVLIIGGIAFYSFYPTEPSSLETGNTQATTSATQNTKPTVSYSASTTNHQPIVVPKNPNTFVSIFNQAGSHVCSYDQLVGSTRTAGSVYIADGKMRAEFRTTGAQNTSSMMVYNGGTLYVWTEGMSTGTKKPLNSVSELPFVIPKDLTSGSVMGTDSNNVSWDCHDWSKNSALLAPPAGVSFY